MPASKAQRTKTAERRSKAVQMRIAGADWESIATTVGYASRGAACTDVTRALEAATAEMTRDVDTLRTLELSRLDKLQASFWVQALRGDTDAARTVLGIIDRRCKLLGLNAPERHEVITLSAMEAEIMRLERDLAADAPAGETLLELPAGGTL